MTAGASRDGASEFDLAVVGLGCIGGSIAARARRLGVRVAGYDRAPALEEALRLGLVDEPLESFEAAAGCGLLVLATPVEVTVHYLERLASLPPRALAVMDVASVKEPVARAGAAIAAFVPTHPFAGSERSGPHAASARLFEHRRWAIVPQGSADARARVRALVTAMGATPLDVEATLHDRTVALTSHLPQLLAVALGAEIARSLDDPIVADLAGPGLASMVRLGASSWEMWRDVLAANRAHLAGDVRDLARALDAYARALDRGDVASLETSFAAAAETVRRLAPATNPYLDASVAPAAPAPALP